jgi:anti-sigma factor RsiW
VSVTDDIVCREMVELMSDYLEGALAGDELGRFERHLAGCDGCDRAMDQLRQTMRLTGMLRVEDVPAEEREALLGVYRAWRVGD